MNKGLAKCVKANTFFVVTKSIFLSSYKLLIIRALLGKPENILITNTKEALLLTLNILMIRRISLLIISTNPKYISNSVNKKKGNKEGNITLFHKSTLTSTVSKTKAECVKKK